MVTLFFPRSPHFLLRSTCSSHGHLFFPPSSIRVFFMGARNFPKLHFISPFLHPPFFLIYLIARVVLRVASIFPRLLAFSHGCSHFPTAASIFPRLLLFSQGCLYFPRMTNLFPGLFHLSLSYVFVGIPCWSFNQTMFQETEDHFCIFICLCAAPVKHNFKKFSNTLGSK